MLSGAQAADLKALGVLRLFVLAGMLSPTEGKVEILSKVEWKGRTDLPVVLVFRAGPNGGDGPDDRSDFGVNSLSAGGYFAEWRYQSVEALIVPSKDHPREYLAQQLAKVMLAQVERAKRHGITVSGIQLDFDVPTRLLKDFAAMLTALRPKLRGLELTTTALPTWLTSRDFANIANAVDSYTLMLYGLKAPPPLVYNSEFGEPPHIPLDAPPFPPITDLSTMAAYICKAEQLGKPYFIGLATFGTVMAVSGGDGEVMHGKSWRDLPEEASRFLKAEKAPGDAGSWEPQLRFLGAPLYGYGINKNEMLNGLAANVTEPGKVRAAMEVVRHDAGPNLKGVTFFRLPVEGEPLVLTPGQVRRALSDEPLTVGLSAVMHAAALGDDRLVHITLENRGLAGPKPEKDSVVLEMELSRPGLEMADEGEFESMTFEEEIGGHTRASSLARATVLRFGACYLEPGGAISTGPLMFRNGGTSVTAHLSYIDPMSARRVSLPAVSFTKLNTSESRERQ